MGGLTNLLTSFFDIIHNFVTSIGITNVSYSYVLDIVIYTFILKMIILPLFIIQQKTTLRMGELSPKLNALKEKYKNDPKKMQEEQIKLYQEMKINPMGGCLPLLIQMPIFMAMYAVIYNFTGFEGVSFLWVSDLAKPDNLYILPVLSGVTTFLSMKISTRNMDPSQQKMQTRMGLFMSLFFVFISTKFKAALVVYLIASSLIQMVQTVMVNKYLGKKKEKEDAIKKAKEEEQKKREAEEKAARREANKKRKKSSKPASSSNVKIASEIASDSTGEVKPKKKKKKRPPVDKEENKGNNTVE